VSDPVISVRDLGFAYGDVVALHEVTLDVPAGCIGLVGANGAGKTTLIKVLLGILGARRGTSQILGKEIPRDQRALRALLGYMPEGSCLPPDQTASDFLNYAAELAGLDTRAARERAGQVLTLVGLLEERFRYLGEYSTGMLQRAKLAQAIVHDPRLVLLDEPTAGLDPDGRQEMLDLIGRLGGFGINAIVSSHVLTEIESTCDWVVMLDGGRVLRSGPLTELAATGEIAVEVRGDPAPVLAAIAAKGFAPQLQDGVIVVGGDAGDPYRAISEALAETGVALRRLGPRRTTLEDIYMAEGGNG
jgi:ABC-2 type transport system ATP-binding protein